MTGGKRILVAGIGNAWMKDDGFGGRLRICGIAGDAAEQPGIVDAAERGGADRIERRGLGHGSELLLIVEAFEGAKGFMPLGEGLALYAAAVEAGRLGLPLLEVGTYCGRSTILLADAAREAGVTAITVDHHRGSEEQQPGWEYHDESTVDPEVGRMDTLPTFRRTLHRAGLEDHVVAIVGRSPQVAAFWGTPVAFVFIDGGHTDEHATADYEGWAPHIAPGGLLVIHDVSFAAHPEWFTVAYGINASAHVVGVAQTSGGITAFLHNGASMIDLNQRISAASGWRLIGALAINDHGTIAAQASLNNGPRRAVLLLPVGRVGPVGPLCPPSVLG